METPAATTRSANPAWRDELLSFWRGMLSWDVSMAGYCTMRAGGPATALALARSRDELARLIPWLEDRRVRWRIIGRGSNMLVSDQGFAGVMIALGGDLQTITGTEPLPDSPGQCLVRVGGACSAARLVGWSVRRSLSGLEFMAGIPGTIGGALCMNAGAWGSEIGSLVRDLTVMDRQGRVSTLSGQDIKFGYRQMSFYDQRLAGAVIVDASLVLNPGRQREIIDRCRELVRRRREKQPAGMPSAGSFFRNPPGDSAGRLIDAAGLKGLRRGNAMVSPVHANFIVNTGGATAGDIIALMEEVQERVRAHAGIRLEPEVHLV